ISIPRICCSLLPSLPGAITPRAHNCVHSPRAPWPSLLLWGVIAGHNTAYKAVEKAETSNPRTQAAWHLPGRVQAANTAPIPRPHGPDGRVEPAAGIMTLAAGPARTASAPVMVDKLVPAPSAEARPQVVAEACSVSDTGSTSSSAAEAAEPQQPHSDEHPAGYYNLGPKEVHPWHKPALPSREAVKDSPHYPVVVTANPMAGSQVLDGATDPAHPLPINSRSVTVDTDMFVGKIEIHLKGLKSTRKDLFSGKKRYFQIACQGKFKREVDADAICMGQEFVKSGNVPPWVAEMVLTGAARVFSSSAHVDIYGRLPYFMNPVLAACQLVNVSRDEDAPKDMWAAQEDLRMFAPELVDKHGKPMSADKRRKWCDVPANIAGRKFTPDVTYTIHIWQHLIDFSSYKLSVGGFVNLDLTAALNAQPLQLTCKDFKNDQYLFSMLVWHEKLIYDDEGDSAMSSLAERFSSMSTGLASWIGRTKTL
ncbi:MAG: hypothetical protein J3K34DRAFT_217390, partial [Monoraphidium minutum]